MRIALVALGSRGDVQPFVALGVGLRARGHEVRLVTTDDFRPLAERAGLAHRSLLAGRPSEFMNSPEFLAAARSTTSTAKITRAMPRPTQEQRERSAAAIDASIRDVDLVVNTPHTRSAMLLGSTVPWCTAALWPITPTSEFPAFGFPRVPFGPYNRMTYRVLAQGEWRFTRDGVNALRRRAGLAPLTRPPFGRQDRTVLYPFSPSVFPPPRDWPARSSVTGYWFWDQGGTVPRALASWLEAGPPPVVATFGSTWMLDGERVLATAVDAARRAGRRLVVVGGPPGAGTTDEVAHVDDVDYALLFPRAAAVVHHGGQGTTAAALRAGVPQVVVPSFADQPFWAARTAALGVAAPPVPFPVLTAARLGTALRTALDDDRIAEAAGRLGDRVAAEHGVEIACDLIEREVASPARTGGTAP